MTSKYNLHSGASHFLPYFAGPDDNLHFSYTSSTMYCRRRVRIDEEVFEYVEARRLHEDSKRLLDAMHADDFVGPASHFSGLSGDVRTTEALDEGMRQFRLVAAERTRLREELKQLNFDSDEHREIEAQLDQVGEDVIEVVSEIEQAIRTLNQASGYDLKTGGVGPAVL